MQPFAELLWGMLKNTWLGCAFYLLRATLVVAYALTAVPIGGPDVDASVLVWLPFFVADLPWSLFFESMKYSSNANALTIYIFVVGIPWIIYGTVIQHVIGWIWRRNH